MPVVSDYTSILPDPIDGSFRWNGMTNLHTPVIVTYSFLESSELPTPGSYGFGEKSYSPFTEAQEDNFRDAVDQYEAAAGIVFVEVDDGGMIDVHNAKGSPYGGWATLPYVTDYYTAPGTLVVDNAGAYNEGSFGFATLLHELGHTMGLLHPHDGPNILVDSLDHPGNTVMTYQFGRGPTFFSSLGAFDIEALQHLYGAPVDVTGWTFTDLGAAFEISGSARADKIMGVAGDNIINGKNGFDHIWGRDGDDSLDGGNGNDTIEAGAGDDEVYGKDGNDSLFGENGDDLLVGGAGADLLKGDTNPSDFGHDELRGNQGRDTLIGGGGSDLLKGGKGKDHLEGGAGADILIGGEGVDTLQGDSGSDTFTFRAFKTVTVDTILDFQLGIDSIDLTDGNFSAGDISISATGSGSLVVAAKHGNEVRFIVENVAVHDLTLDHFEF